MAAALVPDYKAAPEAPEGSVDLQALPVVLSTIEPGDAILSRLNAPLMPLCLSLLREGKAARIEGRDVGAMLIKIAEKFNARTIPQFLQRLEAWRQRRLNRVAKMEDAERKSAEVNDVADTLQAVAEGAKGVTEISTRLASLFEDSKPGGRPAIVLSTTHKAKGLEWEKVVLLNNTYMRKFRGENEPSTEEHNLYYVAITRSKSVLILSEV